MQYGILTNTNTNNKNHALEYLNQNIKFSCLTYIELISKA